VYTLAQIEEKLNSKLDATSTMLATPFCGIVYATVSHFDLDKATHNYVVSRWYVQC